MQSIYDLQVVSDHRIAQRRAQANQERMVREARCANTGTTEHASLPLVGRVLRLRSHHLLDVVTLSFDKAAPRAT
jgi:hypothetical protein